MKGLILKDLLCMKKSALSYLLVAGIYMLITAFGGWDLSMFAVFLVVLVSMLPFSCFSYDRAAKWDLYGLALPVSRRQIVLARYLMLVTMSVLAAALALAFGAAMAVCGQTIAWGEYLASAGGALIGGVLLNALLLPLLYRFGAERARVLFFGVLGAFALVIVILAKFLDDFAQQHAVSVPVTALLAAIAVVTVVLLVISYFVSVRIYQRREV